MIFSKDRTRKNSSPFLKNWNEANMIASTQATDFVSVRKKYFKLLHAFKIDFYTGCYNRMRILLVVSMCDAN